MLWALTPPAVVQRMCAACGGAPDENERPIQRRCAACAAKAAVSVNMPGGADEREADRMADAVVRGNLASRIVSRPMISPMAARSVDGGGASGSAGGAAVGARIDAARGGGQPLPAALRTRFEPRFGANFGRVRVHADGEGDALSRAVHARAFTVGSNLFFRRAEYQPDRPEGQRLIAHELTHVVQQSLGAPAIQRQTDDAFETAQGLDTAIAAGGTMTRDPRIAGHSFTATGCGDLDGCDVTFRMRNAFTGTYDLFHNAAQRMRGVYVSVDASVAEGCSACDRTELIQAVQMIPAIDTATQRARAGLDTPGAASQGWAVDVGENTTPFASSGLFGGHPGRPARPAEGARRARPAQPATMHDDPAFWDAARNMGRDFNTCLFCYPPSGMGFPLASLHWGFHIDAAGAVTFVPRRPAATCGATTHMRDATLRFGALAGNTPARVDFHRGPTGP